MEFIFNIIKYAAIIIGSFYVIKFFLRPVYVIFYNLFSRLRFNMIKKANERPRKQKVKKLYEDHYYNEMNTIYIGKA